jgi:hypothetical protein
MLESREQAAILICNGKKCSSYLSRCNCRSHIMVLLHQTRDVKGLGRCKGLVDLHTIAGRLVIGCPTSSYLYMIRESVKFRVIEKAGVQRKRSEHVL